MIKCKYQKKSNKKIPDIVLYSDITEDSPALTIKCKSRGEVTIIAKNIDEENVMILSHPKNPLANDIIGFLYHLAYHWKNNTSMHYKFRKANFQISGPNRLIPEFPVSSNGRDVTLKIYNDKNINEYISITYNNSVKEVEIKANSKARKEFILTVNGPYGKSSINKAIRNLQQALIKNPVSTQNRSNIEL